MERGGREGFQRRAPTPQRFLLFNSFQPYFCPLPPPSLYPPRDFCGVLVFNHRAHFALLFLFSQRPPPCPLLCFLIEISLMHFLSDFNGLLCLPSFSAFSLSFLFFFHPPPSLPLVPKRNDPRPAGTGWPCC